MDPMEIKKQKIITTLLGLVVLAVIAAFFITGWEEIKFWYQFKNLGRNEQGLSLCVSLRRLV